MSIYFSLDTHLLSDKMADPTLEVTSYIIKNQMEMSKRLMFYDTCSMIHKQISKNFTQSRAENRL